MNEYKKYMYKFVGISLILASVIFIFNVIIDPYGVWKIYQRVGINMYHLDEEKYLRTSKPINIILKDIDVIFLGSSRVGLVLDPQYYSKVTGKNNIYNAGLPTSYNMYEFRRWLEHVIANQPQLKEVIIGIDFFAFNQNRAIPKDFYEQQFEKKYVTAENLGKVCFSMDAIKRSFQCIEENIKNKKNYDVYNDDGKKSEEELKEYYNHKTVFQFTQQTRGFVNNRELYKDYILSEQYIGELRKMVDLCQKNNISVKLFIPPVHVAQFEGIRVSGNWNNFEELKREIVQIAPVYDFSGYDSVSTEKFSEERKFFGDSSHAKVLVGNWILDKLAESRNSDIPSDFGVLITKENIETHLENIRQQREIWAKQNPDFVKYILGFKGFVDIQPKGIEQMESRFDGSQVVINELVDGKTLNVRRKDFLTLYGWAIVANKAPNDIYIRLTSVNGENYYSMANRKKREDVSAFFKNPNYLEAGFAAEAYLDELNPGKYDVTVIQLDYENGKAYYSDVKGQLNVQ